MFHEPRRYGTFDPVIFGLRYNIDGAFASPSAQTLLPLVWRSVHFGPDHQHRDYVRSLADEVDQFDAVAYFSLRVHESRHFHDLLATPYGCMLMRQYFRTALLGQAVTQDLILRRRSIFVPITEWTANPDFLRRQFPQLELPSDSISGFARVVSTMSKKLAVFNQGIVAPSLNKMGLDACGILEGSAITSQELHIAEAYGQDAALMFRRRVSQSPVGHQYYGVRMLLQQMCGEAIPATNFLALCLCCLCGDFQDPDAAHSRYPADLLVELIVWMENKGFQLSRASNAEKVLEAADHFFREVHGRSLMDNLRTASETNLKAVRALEDDAKHLAESGAERAATDLVSGFRNYATAYEGWIRSVFSDPNGYCSVDYSRHLDRHVPAAFFLETEYGIPLTPEIDAAYFVGAGVSLTGDPATIEGFAPRQVAAWNDGTHRTAFLLSPKATTRTSQVNPALIDLDLWQRNFEHTEMIRFLMTGGTRGTSQSHQHNAVATLSAVGTRTFSMAGEMHRLGDVDFDQVGGPGTNELFAQIRRIKEGRSGLHEK